MSRGNSAVPLIELRGVARTFDDGTTGIRDVDLAIASGEFVAIVGPSGAGKSTLLGVLGLLDRQEAGTYLFEGVDIGAASEGSRNRARGRDIGFVFQAAFVLGDAPVLENAALGLRIQGVAPTERYARAEAALATVGVRERAAAPARTLSGGERQRLAVARAIAPRPRLILADEPTGSLDSVNGKRVLDDLIGLHADGATIVLITHDERVASMADRTLRILDGRIVSDEPRRDALATVPHDPLPQAPDRAPRRRLITILTDDLHDALASLGHRVMRAALLVAAFALGAGGLIAALGISESAATQVSDRLTQAALDEVRVTLPGGGNLLAEGSHLERWVDAASKLPHVIDVGYVAHVGAASAGVRRLSPVQNQPTGTVLVVSASPSYLRLAGAVAVGPHSVGLLDDDVRGVALVGREAHKVLGSASPGPGSSLWVAGRQVSVVGEIDAGPRDPSLDSTVVVSGDVIAGLPSVAVVLVVRTEPGYPAPVASALPLALDPADPGRFAVETVADLQKLRVGVSTDLGMFVAIVSLVLITLATVGAATTMYLSVHTRAHEIALRRALGASRTDVARLFLLEGIVVGVVGAATGALLGVAVTLLATNAYGWSPVLPTSIAPLSVALGMFTGLASAAVPAVAAARREPAEAIRG